MTYVFFAWVASISFAFAVIIGKLTSKYSIKNVWLFNFLYALFTFAFIFPLALINHASWPAVWDNLILASLFTALGYIFYVLTLYKLDVSILSPLFNIRTAFNVILGALFLSEILTTRQYYLIIIIILAGIFVSYDEKTKLRSFFTKSIFIALLDMAALSLMGLFLKKSIAQNDYWTVVLWSGFLAQVFLLLTLPKFKKDFLKINLKQILALVLLAVFETIGVLASTKAYADNISISGVIMSIPFSMIFAFLFSIFVPKLLEKHPLKTYLIRFAGAAIMIFCALKLSS